MMHLSARYDGPSASNNYDHVVNKSETVRSQAHVVPMYSILPWIREL